MFRKKSPSGGAAEPQSTFYFSTMEEAVSSSDTTTTETPDSGASSLPASAARVPQELTGVEKKPNAAVVVNQASDKVRRPTDLGGDVAAESNASGGETPMYDGLDTADFSPGNSSSGAKNGVVDHSETNVFGKAQFKKRYLVLNDVMGCLQVYRSLEDARLMTSLPLRSAVFSFPKNMENAGEFEIRVGKSSHKFSTGDFKTAVDWMSACQKVREMLPPSDASATTPSASRPGSNAAGVIMFRAGAGDDSELELQSPTTPEVDITMPQESTSSKPYSLKLPTLGLDHMAKGFRQLVQKATSSLDVSKETPKAETPCDEQLCHRCQSAELELRVLKEYIKCNIRAEEQGPLPSAYTEMPDSVCGLQEALGELRQEVKIKDSLLEDLARQLNELKVQHAQMQDRQERQIDNLQGALEAVTCQNKILNQEVLELSQKCSTLEEQEKNSQLQHQQALARYVQLQSKVLALLKSLDQPRLGPEMESSISSELQEALQDAATCWDDADLSESSRTPRTTGSEGGLPPGYDQHGFLINLDRSLRSALKDIGRGDAHQEVTQAVSTADQWVLLLATVGSGPLNKTAEVKALVRAGVPDCHRSQLWKLLSSNWIREKKEKCGVGYYDELVRRAKDPARRELNPAARQISLDLLRTLPTNYHYEQAGRAGVQRLNDVLSAFSIHNRRVGYCQGMNRLAAVALLFLSAEDAFWCLVGLIERILPNNYFTDTMEGVHADQRVLRDLIAEKLPNLHAHLTKLQVDTTLVTFGWTLTLLVDGAPPALFLHLWDCLLLEGDKVLFRFVLAVLRRLEGEVMKQDNSSDVYTVLHQGITDIIDVPELSAVAFEMLNPFPRKTLQSLRAKHLKAVKVELQRLEQERATRASLAYDVAATLSD